ncbi:MAG: hypothetical protein RMJ66_03610 [Bacteroidia bacterium]|nr:hypothetical protein [Bacteroidia bacterium]MDW8134134.1 hypothetical protein [Bacteroidia bacterium]
MLISEGDTIEFAILFPLPASCTDTSLPPEIPSQGENSGYPFAEGRRFITAARHDNQYSYLNVQLSTTSMNTARGTFSGVFI